MKRMVVFSDLDGTLLDHDTYDWSKAASALQLLKNRRIPVVLTSSKTQAELEVLRSDLGLSDPVVAENGAFVAVPGRYFRDSRPVARGTVTRDRLQQAFERIRTEGNFDCTGFYELGDNGIAAATGLSLPEANRANQRYASEPILWRDSPDRLLEFEEAMVRSGLRCVRGGRFVHLVGQTDKAQALADLVHAYRDKWSGDDVVSIALGDGPNDLEMLRAADIAVVIRGKHGQPMPLGDHRHVLRPRPPGPEGWAQAIQHILQVEMPATTTGTQDDG